ncbi:thiamine phosphate synthase [Rubellicoccus peritrichatus]|uniref:Thiamine-phosphate synthase n=1 Tax=Rubellicoccus peritrichatus TaxID=3080537 RepID=A0AAQ3LDJ5_9BACT|nr:thiamine phosphate synthase [Puniceicoccus sp. CR14]WOO41905.1 thiamine phosphate synthase [Puniceicoccus sp. CR14]
MSFPQASFYGILDTGYVLREHCLEKCKALIAGGAGVVQLRAKKQSRDERRDILQEILPLFESGAVPLILNDDLELALEFPIVGLHVGQDDIPIEEAREALGANRYLGLSTHSPDQAAGALDRAHLLDYFAVGPVFATQTKPDYIPVGLELVKHVASLNPPLPWYCIGGISRSNCNQVKAAGAKGLVAVSDVLCADDTAAAVGEYV